MRKTWLLDLQEQADSGKDPLVGVDAVERLDCRLVGLECREEDIAPGRVAATSLPGRCADVSKNSCVRGENGVCSYGQNICLGTGQQVLGKAQDAKTYWNRSG